jgi:hypothetical protein
MTRSLLAALILLMLVLVSACEKGPPTRVDVARIVSDEFEKPTYFHQTTLTLGYSTKDEQQSDIQREKPQYHTDYWCLAALKESGLIGEFSFVEKRQFHPWAGGPVERHFWSAATSDTAIPFVTSTGLTPEKNYHNYPDNPMPRLPTITAILARPELIEVTGITAPAETPYGPMPLEAEFSYRWQRTPFGDAVAKARENACLSQEIPGDIQHGKISFTKFDDGWRPDSPVSLPWGEPIAPRRWPI